MSRAIAGNQFVPPIHSGEPCDIVWNEPVNSVRTTACIEDGSKGLLSVEGLYIEGCMKGSHLLASRRAIDGAVCRRDACEPFDFDWRAC